MKTFEEPMVLVLHIGYSFIPLGFFALAFSLIFPTILNEAGAVHLWTAGAVGMTTIAMMTRVSLGHSGRRPEANKVISLIYLTLFIAIIVRFLSGFWPEISFLIHTSGTFWILSYAIFIIHYWKILTA